MKKVFLGLILACSAACAVTAPAGFTVVSATNTQVQLSWNAAPDSKQYIVERRAVDSTDYSTLATIARDANNALATTFTDTGFDPFTAYVYRVRAMDDGVTPAEVSDPTGEVTVGPPPYGYTRVVPTPDKQDSPGQFGANTQIVLDRNGDPMLSYLNVDPNGDRNFADTEIRFVRWDRASYTWTKPVPVAVSDIDSSYSYNHSYRFAMDASSGALAIVYIDNSDLSTNLISLADSSDNGITWRRRKVVGGPNSYFIPAVALGNGQVYLTYSESSAGVRYMTGKFSESPASWSLETVPDLGSAQYGIGSDIALDSDGKPGLAYLLSGGDTREIFYRPGAKPTVANTSKESPGDEWQIRLAFFGVNPRIAFSGRLDSHYSEDYDHLLFLLASQDSGATWNPPANIKSDGGSFLSGPIDLTFDSNGAAALTSREGAANAEGEVCGYPKLSLSSDLQTWSTCGVTSTIRSRESSSGVKFAANGTLYLAISIGQYPADPTSAAELPAGLYFWRGPLGFQFPTTP